MRAPTKALRLQNKYDEYYPSLFGTNKFENMKTLFYFALRKRFYESHLWRIAVILNLASKINNAAVFPNEKKHFYNHHLWLTLQCNKIAISI